VLDINQLKDESMKGRPLKPTKLKMLQGTQKPSRINPREPEPDVEIPDVPTGSDGGPVLTGLAKAEWDYITPILEEQGLIAKINRNSLARYCILSARFIKANEKIEEEGEIVTLNAGRQANNPWIKVQRDCASELRRLEESFCMTNTTYGKFHAKPHDDSKKKKSADRFFK